MGNYKLELKALKRMQPRESSKLLAVVMGPENVKGMFQADVGKKQSIKGC